MKYHANPEIMIEAEQWWPHAPLPGVDPYNHADRPLGTCQECFQRLEGNHGWIKTLEGGHIVCPGDFIVTGTVGEKYPVKPRVFVNRWLPGSLPDLSTPAGVKQATDALARAIKSANPGQGEVKVTTELSQDIPGRLAHEGEGSDAEDAPA